MSCDHLLGNGWPLSSCLWCLIVQLSPSPWYAGSGVVLDCIDSRSLPPFVLALLQYCVPRRWDFSFGNRYKSEGTISGENGGWGGISNPHSVAQSKQLVTCGQGVAASIRLHTMHRLSCNLAQDNQSWSPLDYPKKLRPSPFLLHEPS